MVPSADFVYSGNVQQWIKFANSLKLRLAMRISYANPTKAKEMAESAVKHEFGVIEENEDNAAWHYFGTITNSLFTVINYNGDESRPSADIVCYMNGYKDNRRASYFKNEDGAWNQNTFVGLRRSIDRGSSASQYFSKYSAINISAGDPVQWMNAAEVAFLRAEGVAVFGFDLGGTAQSFYEQGVRLSFEQWELPVLTNIWLMTRACLKLIQIQPELIHIPAQSATSQSNGMKALPLKKSRNASLRRSGLPTGCWAMRRGQIIAARDILI